MEVIFTCSLGILLLALFVGKDWSHPVVLMLGIWAFVLLLYNLQAFQIIPPTTEIVGVLADMLGGFLAGCGVYYLFRMMRNKRFVVNPGGDSVHREEGKAGNGHLREALFFVLCSIAALVMLVDQFHIIQSVLGGASFADVMKSAEGKGTVEITGTAQVALYMFIVHPMTACVSPICAVEVLTRRDGRVKYFLVNLIIVFLAVFHHGGRNAIIVMCLSYLLAYALLRKDRVYVPRNVKVAFILGGALACVAVFALSSSRGIQDIWLSFYAYFITSIPLGQQYLAASHFIAGHTLGFFSLQGITYPLYSVLAFIGVQPPELYDMASMMSNYIEANYLSIGDYSVTGMNTFMPAGAYPYVDGGYIFEFVFMALYGYVSCCLYQRRGQSGEKSKAIYVLWAYGLLLSFCRLYFASYSYILGLLLMAFVLYGKKPKKRIAKNDESRRYE